MADEPSFQRGIRPPRPGCRRSCHARAGTAGLAQTQNSLKGTKLTILVGQFYVPENNTQLDQLAADLAQGYRHGYPCRASRAATSWAPRPPPSSAAGAAPTCRSASSSTPISMRPKLADVTDLADEIGKSYGGWYDVAKQACIVDGRWKSLCLGQAPAAWNYRVDQFQAAGIDKFPDTFDELLVAAKALHAKGTPIGMTLGHASGDGRSTNYPVLWAFGGKEFEADGKTVALNSPETLKAVEWYAEIYKYFIPGTTAWLDPDNNQAFLAGKCSATVNVNTIYLAARAAAPTDPAMKNIAENMDHGNWPAGPAGRFANYNINVWLPFASSQNRAGQMAFLRAWFDRKVPAALDQDRTVVLHPDLRRLRALRMSGRRSEAQDLPRAEQAQPAGRLCRPADAGGRGGGQQIHPRRHVRQGLHRPDEAGDAVKWAEREYQQIVKKRASLTACGT